MHYLTIFICCFMDGLINLYNPHTIRFISFMKKCQIVTEFRYNFNLFNSILFIHSRASTLNLFSDCHVHWIHKQKQGLCATVPVPVKLMNIHLVDNFVRPGFHMILM